ncbi:hypothetical protein [Elizabethkingia bruuniana]|nr:hypothetical protein [Elizabethkingia bruuniana]
MKLRKSLICIKNVCQKVSIPPEYYFTTGILSFSKDSYLIR